MNALSESLITRIRRLRPDWDTTQLSGFIYLEGGYSNDNYRFAYQGERFVLRAPYRARAYVDRHLEREVYGGPAGVMAPEIVAFDAESGDMISRWVGGTLLADCEVAPAELVDYLVRLHGGLPAVARAYDPLAQALGHLEEARAPAWLERLAQGLTWRPEVVKTCHNDLNPWNVIRRPGGEWVTLDWEWVGTNDPLFDLVTLHQGAGLEDGVLVGMGEEYLWGGRGREAAPTGGWGSGRGLETAPTGGMEAAPKGDGVRGREAAPTAGERLEGRLRRCLVVFWLRETAWALAEVAGGNDRPEVLEQRDLGLRRLEALAG